MSGPRTDDANAPDFEVSEERAPVSRVLDVEEDEEAKRQREAALASTFDPERAHDGKTDEELIAEREQEARTLVDVAIAAGVVIAVVELSDDDPNFENAGASDDGGE